MTKINILKSLFIISLIFSLSSCITIERNIKINEDGSGNETTTIYYGKEYLQFIINAANSKSVINDTTGEKITLDSIFNDKSFADDIKDKYKKLKGVKVKNVIVKFGADSTLIMKIDYSFNKTENMSSSFYALEGDNISFGRGRPEIIFKKDGKKINFRYKYAGTFYSDSTQSFKNSLAGFFHGEKMIFNITFPYTVKSSNASKTKDKTLHWEFDMENFLTDTNIVELNAEMKK